MRSAVSASVFVMIYIFRVGLEGLFRSVSFRFYSVFVFTACLVYFVGVLSLIRIKIDYIINRKYIIGILNNKGLTFLSSVIAGQSNNYDVALSVRMLNA